MIWSYKLTKTLSCMKFYCYNKLKHHVVLTHLRVGHLRAFFNCPWKHPVHFLILQSIIFPDNVGDLLGVRRSDHYGFTSGIGYSIPGKYFIFRFLKSLLSKTAYGLLSEKQEIDHSPRAGTFWREAGQHTRHQGSRKFPWVFDPATSGDSIWNSTSTWQLKIIFTIFRNMGLSHHFG